jgi:CheY-like chemotaxis protein
MGHHDDSAALIARLEAAERTIETMRARAHELDGAMDAFLAVVSHELRSPLSAILTWARILRTGRLDAGRTETALQTIERSARLQVRLIEDLLDASRMMSGKLFLEPGVVDLRGVVAAAVERARPAAHAKDVTVSVEVAAAAVVYGDEARLDQVLDNVLSNAVKFTPDGGHVGVVLDTVEGDARVTVRDTGPGIAADFLPHVFERFRQADTSSTRRHGGLGLGLAIVRHLVELHGGSIAAANRPEGGAALTLRLPLHAAARDGLRTGGTAVPYDDAGAAHLRGVRVLVVDDDADAAQAIAAALELHGAEVRTAASAQAALEAVAAAVPDVLVTDIAMPDADGYDFLQRLRAPDGGRPAVPAIALTGYAGPADRDRALAAGFAVHLAKPVAPEDLVATIRKLLAADAPRPGRR